MKLQIAQAEADLQRVEAKLKNETGIAKAQRDFDIKKGIKLCYRYHVIRRNLDFVIFRTFHFVIFCYIQ